ncbi:MAG: pentapeptide repeat-containing protein [Cyanobacteria bacterium]|nr:pentapeptide repeat-containing protein [Cyanobacteriota bacterium]MDA1246623.1 pentapeptide repeat-containing protein [Cyanobacteriota bacterium]
MEEKQITHLLPKNPAEWLAPEEREPNSSQMKPVDARGANWRNKVLPNLDLREANLCRVDLRGTNLTACQLKGCKLTLARYDNKTKVPDGFDLERSGAVGPGAILNGAFLNGADLRGMDLHDAKFIGSYLSGCDLSGAVLNGASFAGADLRYAKLRSSSCVGTRFGSSQMNHVDLRAANIKNAALDTAESIQGADFSLVKGIDIRQLENLLMRSQAELDCWNPLTRQTTRKSLESLGQSQTSNI